MSSKIAVVFAAIITLACASTSWAGLDEEVYRSVDAGGKVLMGRLSQSETESVKVAKGDEVFGVASWNGTWLGTQWGLSCGVQSAPAEVKADLDDKGNGVVITVTLFEGGSFQLSQIGPWGPKFGFMAGNIITNRVVLTETYEAALPVKAELVSESYGVDKLGRTVRFDIARCLAWGEVEKMQRFGYPPLLDTSCQPTRNHGYWGDMGDVTIAIVGKGRPMLHTQSEVDGNPPAAPATTWGAVKIRYR